MGKPLDPVAGGRLLRRGCDGNFGRQLRSGDELGFLEAFAGRSVKQNGVAIGFPDRRKLHTARSV